MERFVIYVVNKEEYDTCRIMDQHPRVIARCTTPHKLQFITISFRSFTPIPGALEYRPGQDYYFISTSSKTDLHQRVGGMCHDNNMKLIVKVADPNAPTTTTTTTTTTKAPPSPPPLVRDHDADATKSLSEEKQRRRKNRRRRRKERNNSSKRKNSEDLNQDEVLNDKPVKVAEKQPSFVEKVKNYMKQEASITSASATSGQDALMRRLDLLVLLSLSFPLAWVIC